MMLGQMDGGMTNGYYGPPYLTSHLKITSKWNEDLKVSAKTMKVSEENI